MTINFQHRPGDVGVEPETIAHERALRTVASMYGITRDDVVRLAMEVPEISYHLEDVARMYLTSFNLLGEACEVELE